MEDETRSRNYTTEQLNKLDGYLKRPEGLMFETDKLFLGNASLMLKLALGLKKESSLASFPKELKNDEDFMLNLIRFRPNAYNYAGQKLSKSPEFAVAAIKANPDSIDAVFFKHENFFNNLQVINEALKYEQSDYFNVTEAIDEHIHKKNLCSKEDLLEMFGDKRRSNYLVRMYENQVLDFSEDANFMKAVSKENDFIVPDLNLTLSVSSEGFRALNKVSNKLRF